MSDAAYGSIPSAKPESLDALAELYGPIVDYWVFKFYNKDRDAQRSVSDMKQDAWTGILEAWNSWTPDRGATFRTYAGYRARWAVMNGQRQVDVGLSRVYVNLSRAKGEKNKESMKQLYSGVLAMASLDDGDTAWEPSTSFDHACESGDSFAALLAMVPNPRTRMILDQHYRMDRPLADIGRELGVSRERVRQLLVQGREDIRRGLGARGIVFERDIDR